MLQIARKKAYCRVLGPGLRSVIWFHGCSKKCVHCIAESMNNAAEFEVYTPNQLKEWVCNNQGIEGITLSGGEPFEQTIDLLEDFLEKIRYYSNLSIICYTGKILEDIRKNENERRILPYLDVLIDGEYQIGQDTGKRWRGSDNQRFHFLTSRYRDESNHWNAATGRELEFDLGLDGKLGISGVPPKNFLSRFSKQLQQKNVLLNITSEKK